MRRPLALLVAAATAAALLVAPGAPTQAAASPAAKPRPGKVTVATRTIEFSLTNRNLVGGICTTAPDREIHPVRARLIGPKRVVEGRAGVKTFNVLVHDAGTGGWFWNLQGAGAPYDYATQLAERGQTTVVLDRLGYDSSPLADGDATCLGAQATMLEQVVQHLYSGVYRVVGRPRASIPHASHVVLHGHGTGATIARMEAARYSDVQGLVLMSPPTTSPSTLALQTLQGQAATCLRGAGFAPYGDDAATFRRLLFHSAPARVQRAAARLRNSTPCGDVGSLVPSILTGQGGEVDVPTLVLTGGADARRGGDGITGSSSAPVVRRTIAGAGSALVLEKQAPAVRRAVLSFVRSLDDRVR